MAPAEIVHPAASCGCTAGCMICGKGVHAGPVYGISPTVIWDEADIPALLAAVEPPKCLLNSRAARRARAADHRREVKDGRRFLAQAKRIIGPAP